MALSVSENIISLTVLIENVRKTTLENVNKSEENIKNNINTAKQETDILNQRIQEIVNVVNIKNDLLTKHIQEFITRADRDVLVLQGRLEVFNNLSDLGVENIVLPKDEVIEVY